MSESEKQLSFSRAASRTSGRAKKHILHPLVSCIMGIMLISLPVVAVALQPELSSRAGLYLRVIAACGGALIGAALPGFLHVKMNFARAGGALAVFLLIYFFDPAQKIARGGVSADDEEKIKQWQTHLDTKIPWIQKPQEFPSRLNFEVRTIPGSYYYLEKHNLFVERVADSLYRDFYFRPVKSESNFLYVLDDSRNIAIMLPVSNGPSYYSDHGLKGNYSDLYEVRIKY